MKILKRLGHLFLEVIAKGPGGMILRHLENREKLKEYEEEKRIQAILRQLEKTPSVCMDIQLLKEALFLAVSSRTR